MRILSIASAVAYGHVGNSAVVFPLQRLGHEVLPVFTVQFSNHTGYGAWRGPVLSAADVHEVILGIEERGVLGGIDLVLTGYLGSPALAEVVLDAVERVRRANPAATYACDPVVGNATRGRYVDPAIPGLLRDGLITQADVATPNQFELGLLTGSFDGSADAPAPSRDAIVAAARDLGPATVLVTSVLAAGEDPAEVGMLAVTRTDAWQVRTPRLPIRPAGSGDVTAALFAAHLGTSGSVPDALARTASSIFDLLERTVAAGAGELLLIEAQEVFATPRMQFAVRT